MSNKNTDELYALTDRDSSGFLDSIEKHKFSDPTQLLTAGQCGILYPRVRRDAAIICCIKEKISMSE
ncbi:MAG: hypothetical protein IK990_04915 [Ruminiclostridium sp.]|nr:hypothetical protein [Ruminiclostridium sp.]